MTSKNYIYIKLCYLIDDIMYKVLKTIKATAYFTIFTGILSFTHLHAKEPVDVYGGIPNVSIQKVKFNTLKEGVEMAFASGDMGSFGIIKIKKGVVAPMHYHLPEAIIHVQSGKMKFFIGSGNDIKEYTAGAGEIVLVKSNVPHGAKALENSTYTISSSPVRKDWINKTDTYSIKENKN